MKNEVGSMGYGEFGTRNWKLETGILESLLPIIHTSLFIIQF